MIKIYIFTYSFEILNININIIKYTYLYVLQNVSLLNNKVNNKKYLCGRNINHKYISIREYMVYYILLYQQIPTYVENISTYRTKYVRTGNLHKSKFTQFLRKRHGQSFGAPSQIFCLNNLGDTILFNSVGKMPTFLVPN